MQDTNTALKSKEQHQDALLEAIILGLKDIEGSDSNGTPHEVAQRVLAVAEDNLAEYQGLLTPHAEVLQKAFMQTGERFDELLQGKRASHFFAGSISGALDIIMTSAISNLEAQHS